MAFVSGNLGKEILHKAMKNANIRPNTANIRIQKPKIPQPQTQQQTQNQSPAVPKIDALAVRTSSNPQVEGISPTILPYRNIPNEQVKCSCHICQEKAGVKLRPGTAQVVAKPRMDIREGDNKGFSHLLKLMLPDRGNAPKGLKFLIADTLVFTGGEPKFFMYNSRNKYIRFIKQKDKLALPEMKKFFLARKQRKELDGINFFNENTLTMGQKIKEWKQKAKDEKEEPYWNAYERSSNHQNSPSRKEKRMMDSTAHREIVICKYTDESLQVFSELDFSYLMMKRKIEAVWLQLDYIQSYIKLKNAHPYYIRVDYDHERDIKNPFYERAREFVYYMSQEREPELDGFDYTTAEDIFEEDLKRTNIYEYCQYLNFKFACYMDAYCAARIKHMITEYAWEDTNLVYLVNAYNIKFFNIAEQNDYLLREVDIVNEEEKQKANDRIYGNKASPYQGKVEVLWAFRQYYEDMKSDLDINKEFEETILENPTSNEAFKIINPETTFTLYDVMTNVKEFEKFKNWLMNRSKEPGKLGKLFGSALRFAEASATANMSKASATKTQKSSTHRHKERNEAYNSDNAAKLFQKKMKILDICGNGVSRKKYIHTSEVLYRSDVVSGRKIIALDSTHRSKMMSPMMSDQSTGRGLNMTATPSRQFRIRSSQKNATPVGGQGQNNSQFDLSILNKTKSLASMLYVKPDQL